MSDQRDDMIERLTARVHALESGATYRELAKERDALTVERDALLVRVMKSGATDARDTPRGTSAHLDITSGERERVRKLDAMWKAFERVMDDGAMSVGSCIREAVVEVRRG